MLDPLAIILIVAHITATVALFNGFITTLSQAKIACTAIDSIARQPEASDSIRTAMIIGLAMAETNGIYGLIIAIVMLFANPLIPIYINYIS